MSDVDAYLETVALADRPAAFDRFAREHGIRLARDWEHGCWGCRDGDNVRSPTVSGVPRRCGLCPVRSGLRLLRGVDDRQAAAEWPGKYVLGAGG